MNRDAILATLIGLGLGLVITGILVAGPAIVAALPKITFPTISFPQLQKGPTPESTPSPTPFTLTIGAPLPEAIAATNQLVVSGATTPDSVVVVAGPLDEDVVVVNQDGQYVGKVTLAEGKNDISVTSYWQAKQAQQNVIVFYTPENF